MSVCHVPGRSSGLDHLAPQALRRLTSRSPGAMKYLEQTQTIELSVRNIHTLALKLDDPRSARTLVSSCGQVAVRAVEDAEITEEQTAAARSERLVIVTRSQLGLLAVGDQVRVAEFTMVPVPDSAHYSDRPAGVVYMPSSGEHL